MLKFFKESLIKGLDKVNFYINRRKEFIKKYYRTEVIINETI